MSLHFCLLPVAFLLDYIPPEFMLFIPLIS